MNLIEILEYTKKLMDSNSAGKKVSYYDDKCELNLKLFKLIEEELSSFKHDRDYWNEERIRNRIGFITQEFKNAMIYIFILIFLIIYIM